MLDWRPARNVTLVCLTVGRDKADASASTGGAGVGSTGGSTRRAGADAGTRARPLDRGPCCGQGVAWVQLNFGEKGSDGLTRSPNSGKAPIATFVAQYSGLFRCAATNASHRGLGGGGWGPGGQLAMSGMVSRAELAAESAEVARLRAEAASLQAALDAANADVVAARFYQSIPRRTCVGRGPACWCRRSDSKLRICRWRCCGMVGGVLIRHPAGAEAHSPAGTPGASALAPCRLSESAQRWLAQHAESPRSLTSHCALPLKRLAVPLAARSR